MSTKLLINIFQVVCVALAAYMIQSQIYAFIENKDLSLVSYPTFNQELQDTYPTLSACALPKIQFPTGFSSPNFNANGTSLTEKDYYEMLRGKRSITSDFDKIQFDDVRVDFMSEPKILKAIYVTGTAGRVDQKNPPTWQSEYRSGSIYTSYQDPYFVCISKPLKYMKDVILNEVVLTMALADNYTGMLNGLRFYIHEEGQLIQTLKRPQLTVSNTELMEIRNNKRDNRMILQVQKMERLRKRSDAVIPCDNKNEDLQYIATAIQLAQCTPTYWTRFKNEFAAMNFEDKPGCTNQSQYKMFDNEYLTTWPNAPSYMELAKRYKQPCLQTTFVVRPQTAKGGRKKKHMDLIFAVNFNTLNYQNVENMQAFDEESLWSQIGGFVGIFLGYSLLQVPELTIALLVFLKRVFKKHAARRYDGSKNIQHQTQKRTCSPQPKIEWVPAGLLNATQKVSTKYTGHIYFLYIVSQLLYILVGL